MYMIYNVFWHRSGMLKVGDKGSEGSEIRGQSARSLGPLLFDCDAKGWTPAIIACRWQNVHKAVHLTLAEEEEEDEEKDDRSNPTAPTTAHEKHWREGGSRPAARLKKNMQENDQY